MDKFITNQDFQNILIYLQIVQLGKIMQEDVV